MPLTYAIIPPHRCRFPIVRGCQIKSSTDTVVVVVVVDARPLARPPTIMPGAGAIDPANLQVHAHAQLGLSWELEQTRRVTPHPSHGCSGDVDVSESSLRRWRERLHPYRQTGRRDIGVGEGQDLPEILIRGEGGESRRRRRRPVVQGVPPVDDRGEGPRLVAEVRPGRVQL